MWLGASANETLGGNYGEETPSDLSFNLHAGIGADEDTCEMDKDPWPKIYSNSITALTSAELVRRLVLHREVPSEFRLPGLTWNDVSQILNGAGVESTKFPGVKRIHYCTNSNKCMKIDQFFCQQNVSNCFLHFLSKINYGVV